MQDGMNLNEISGHTVVRAESAAANQGTAQRPIDGVASQRHVGDVAECTSQLGLKLVSQPRPLLLVP